MTFYNTTNLNGKELAESKEKALSQTQLILNNLHTFEPISAWIIKNSGLFPEQTPVTSIRRSLTSIHKMGKIEVIGDRIGNHKRKELTYKIV